MNETRSIESQADMDQYAQEIARLLDPQCRVEPLPQNASLSARIVDGDGRALDLVRCDDRRLRVQAQLPEDAPVRTPSIRVSALTPKHVADHIRRRLLPQHAEALEKAEAEKVVREAEQRARGAVAEKLASLVPGAYVNPEYPGPRHTTVSFQRREDPEDLWFTGRIWATVGPRGDSVELEIHALSEEAEHALRGLASLDGWCTRKGDSAG
ncbi:hypothetical protein [Streptomyces melanosporofaciens]|uniref:Uncharacterized protein n=1 Tax=Streptomyces melanosporofaciens TaxID=67327 RepID=A0A1H4IDQ3_STRMJ|nr:hypothetical protein [Streptomyces melanosporofaciens]SEB31826.1 hypothetical protein SAMN04490356_0518 [Streptomyces melanosporofaciens]